MTDVTNSITEKDLTVNRGKYKGQNVMNLMNDQSYLTWLYEQKSETSIGLLKHFKEQNPIVYSIVINNCTPKNVSSTPEHNKLQNKFMNPDIIDNFLKLYWAEPHRKVKVQGNSYSIMEALNVILNPIGFHFHKFTGKWQFETFYNWDVVIRNVDIILRDDEGKEYSFDDLYDKLEDSSGFSRVRDEARHVNYLIELKPVVGDDYPEILRKIKTQTKNMYFTKIGTDKFGREYSVRKPVVHEYNYRDWRPVLILSDYQSESTSFDQLEHIFNHSDVNVYKFDDIIANPYQQCSTSSP